MRTFREAQEYVVVQELVKADGFNEGDPAELTQDGWQVLFLLLHIEAHPLAHILLEVAHRDGRDDIIEALDVLVK